MKEGRERGRRKDVGGMRGGRWGVRIRGGEREERKRGVGEWGGEI